MPPANGEEDAARSSACGIAVTGPDASQAISVTAPAHSRSATRRRSAVEREFGRLKHRYALAMLRVRGIERVRLHSDLTILGRLALAQGLEQFQSPPRFLDS